MTADRLSNTGHTTRKAGHRHTRQLTHWRKASLNTSSRSAYSTSAQPHVPTSRPSSRSAKAPLVTPYSCHTLGAPLTASWQLQSPSLLLLPTLDGFFSASPPPLLFYLSPAPHTHPGQLRPDHLPSEDLGCKKRAAQGLKKKKHKTTNLKPNTNKNPSPPQCFQGERKGGELPHTPQGQPGTEGYRTPTAHLRRDPGRRPHLTLRVLPEQSHVARTRPAARHPPHHRRRRLLI